MAVPKTCTESPQPYAAEWIDWIEENLMLDVPISRMIEAMEREGISCQIAEVMIRTVRLTRAGRGTREKKMEWILDSLAGCDEGGDQGIAERGRIDTQEFYGAFYATNTPVLIKDWKEYGLLRDRLSWSALQQRYGDRSVEIQERRTEDPGYERNSRDHKGIMNFKAFLDIVTSGKENNDVYLTANNGRQNEQIFSPILESGEWMPELLDREDVRNTAFVWIGPKGTVTQLHHDLTNNLLLQVAGKKRVYLFPPCYFTKVYNHFHCYSEFDCENPDYDRFPSVQKIRIRQCDLEEGQMLFLPLGWWHQVRSLSPSISITAINFLQRNSYSDQYGTFEAIS